MKKITHNQLADLIASRPGAFPVGILSVTDAKARKTGNPFGTIRKVSRSVGFVGASYQSAVRSEGERQNAGRDAASFVALPRPWGEWVKGSENKLATHKGRFYLRTQSTPGQRQRQRARVLAYLGESGQFIAKEEAQKFIPEKSFSARQASVGIGESDREQIDVREFAFNSIRKIRFSGVTYEVTNEEGEGAGL